jgi:hypothetical protein
LSVSAYFSRLIAVGKFVPRVQLLQVLTVEPPERAKEWSEFDLQPEFRWFSESALRPVHELNAYLLELLVKAAKEGAIGEQHCLTSKLGSLLQALDVEACHRAAKCPISLVDGGFGRATRWPDATSFNIMQANARLAIFPEPEARQLAHMTLTLAWTMARENRDAARIVFAMDRGTIGLLSGLGISALQQLADRLHHWVSPRWADDPAIWRTLLLVALRGEHPRLPPIGMRLMQRQLADLEPATRGDEGNRQLRR